ncbi:GntR family transcriptional regulator [Amycolatopsis speibonae]|uniref:GntR family transcriptional regulator n=1 Tax=Amycolatopsis speibonae TaxID=1450224 RepID=A0ABV7P3V1_9PSEU
MARGKTRADSPSKLIAADIRQHIVSGELAPGDRVPSTRAISEKWGVAHATATKVLAILREEGLVEAVPGAWTLVAGGSTQEAVWRIRERIVEAATDIADVSGLDAASMRAIAARLDGAVMSLYHYVKSREELVLLMADAAFGEMIPADGLEGWRPRLDASARSLWSGYRRHPWLVQVNLGRQLRLPNVVGHMAWTFSALVSWGMDSPAALRQYVLLHSFVHGAAANLLGKEGLSACLRGDPSFGEESEKQAEAHSPLVPFISNLRDLDLRSEVDDPFEVGLRQLLDGCGKLLEDPA